jgi:hypothetical protein
VVQDRWHSDRSWSASTLAAHKTRVIHYRTLLRSCLSLLAVIIAAKSSLRASPATFGFQRSSLKAFQHNCELRSKNRQQTGRRDGRKLRRPSSSSLVETKRNVRNHCGDVTPVNFTFSQCPPLPPPPRQPYLQGMRPLGRSLLHRTFIGDSDAMIERVQVQSRLAWRRSVCWRRCLGFSSTCTSNFPWRS